MGGLLDGLPCMEAPSLEGAVLMRSGASAAHEKLAQRLAAILVRLNEGGRLVPKALAEQFGVSVRTIQRDIARFGGLGLHKVDDAYEIEQTRLGRLGFKELERFAQRSGIGNLFPSLRDGVSLASESEPGAMVRVQGHAYEDLRNRRHDFMAMHRAIAEHRQLSFSFDDVTPRKVYDAVEPYGLVNLKGIWYLAGQHNGRTKTFSFARISGLLVSAIHFQPDAVVAARIASEDGIWFQDESMRILIEVAPPAAPYFRRRRLVSYQEIVEERRDGSLLVAMTVGHENQVLPIVRYWIPHVRIIDPADMQARLEEQLRHYAYGSGSASRENTTPS